MIAEREQLEAELGKDQVRLLPGAERRLEAVKAHYATLAAPTKDDTKKVNLAANYVGYLKMKPKTLWSVFVNQPAISPMFRNWSLADRCCRALGAAARAGVNHPLVEVDPYRPSVRGDKYKPGSAGAQPL